VWPGVLNFLGYDPRPPVPPTIGGKLHHHREAQGLSAAKVAQILDLDPATMTKWELKDDRHHNHLSIPRIIRFLGYNPLPQPESLGQYIRQVRYAAGLKQTEFAARLRVSNDALSAWELDKRKPTLAQLDCVEVISMRLDAPFRRPCPEHLRAKNVEQPRAWTVGASHGPLIRPN